VALRERPSAEELVEPVEGAAARQAVAGVRSVTAAPAAAAAAEEEVEEEAVA